MVMVLTALEVVEERRILLRRLFYTDRDFYNIGKLGGIKWFETFDAKFGKDTYAYFADEERKEALDLITKELPDDSFIKAVNTVYGEKERYHDIDTFVGRHYYFDKKTRVKCEDRRSELEQQTRNALKDTKGRGFYFLKAVIDLNKEEKWDRAYGGASWVDILAKVRELRGPYPSPRDLAILKSYRIYYRTGSRRYPTHTVPAEMIPTIEKILMTWQNNNDSS